MTEFYSHNTIIFWYDRLLKLYHFLSVSYKKISETLIWDCWWVRLSHHVLTKLQHWDSAQVIRQSVHEILTQLNTIINYESFWSYSDIKKDCQYKNYNRDKSTTQTLYYDKLFTDSQTSYHLLYCEHQMYRTHHVTKLYWEGYIITFVKATLVKQSLMRVISDINLSTHFAKKYIWELQMQSFLTFLAIILLSIQTHCESQL